MEIIMSKIIDKGDSLKDKGDTVNVCLHELPRFYVSSQMDVTQNLIYITLRFILPKLLVSIIREIKDA